MNALALSLTPSISSNKQRISGLPIVGWGGAPPSNNFFQKVPPIKTDAPHWLPPTHFKNEAHPPSEKQSPPTET